MVTKKVFNDLQDRVQNQDKIIEELQRKIVQFEVRLVLELSSAKALSAHVSSVLQEKLDHLQQYSRRSCIIIDGLDANQNETTEHVVESAKAILSEDLGIDKGTVNFEFDKAHRIGAIDKNNKQKLIIKFRSHNFKERVYKARNECKNKALKFKPSLTKRRQDLLSYAYENFKDHENFAFVFTDVHGNLKLRTKVKIKNKYVFNFNNEATIAELMIMLDDEYRNIYNGIHSWYEDE